MIEWITYIVCWYLCSVSFLLTESWEVDRVEGHVGEKKLALVVISISSNNSGGNSKTATETANCVGNAATSESFDVIVGFGFNLSQYGFQFFNLDL